MAGSSEQQVVDWQRRAKDLERVNRVGVALSAEQNKNRLLELILLEAKELTRADGGTLYLADTLDGNDRADPTHLRFVILRNDTLKVARGGTTGEPIDLYPVRLLDDQGRPNHKNVASYCAATKRSVNVADAYTEPGFDFETDKFWRVSTTAVPPGGTLLSLLDPTLGSFLVSFFGFRWQDVSVSSRHAALPPC